MTAKAGVPAQIGKQAVESLAIAMVYIATAQPGFLIAIPPGNVTGLFSQPLTGKTSAGSR